ncbi:serine hydroxymethyltransferase [bacterium]|nr:serine hydroxymethyltransferase [bacterium]
MKTLEQLDPEVSQIITAENEREAERLQLIASENYTSPAVLEAQGSVFTNKYAEGYPGARYYQGCGPSDRIEQLALDRVKTLFGAEHANVQPHSGSSANMAAYLALLQPGDTILGMDLAAGGHLTHGAGFNFSGKIFKSFFYKVQPENQRIDYNVLAEQARKIRPRLIIAGASAYPRTLDFVAFRSICDEVGAYLLVDMAHIAGLIAGGVHPSPVPYADVVTSTTHKTLRGPRSGFILCRKEYAKAIDAMVFPGLQGGPLMHVISAKAVAFKEAMEPAFSTYARQIVSNARTLAQVLQDQGFTILTGGTDNHIVLIDIGSMGMTGAEAAERLEAAGIVANKNSIPNDPRGPRVTSGIRLGTAAVTTRGMKENEMGIIAKYIGRVIRGSCDSAELDSTRQAVAEFCRGFPVFPEL